MRICVYMCKYIYIYRYIYLCIHVYIYKYIFTHIYVNVCVFLYEYVLCMVGGAKRLWTMQWWSTLVLQDS